MSHTCHWALLAVATQPVGVEVEEISVGFDFASLPEHSCSATEQLAIGRSPDPRRQFYQLWTRKEAFVKATGQGIDEHFAAIPALDGRHLLDGRHQLAGVGSAPTGPDWLVSSLVVAIEGCAGPRAGSAPPALGPAQLATLPLAWLSAQLAP